MFYNRISTNNDVNDKVRYVGADEEYFHSTYNVIISKIDEKHQYENYYIVNTEMLYYKKNNYEVEQIDALHEVVNNVISDDMISKIKNGKGLLIFDFGCEIIPISTDETTLYGKINKFFYEKDCVKGVQYWTMFERPFDLVDKSECHVDIISVSLSTLRYTDFGYHYHRNTRTDASIEPKSMIYLNRQPRIHRIQLLAECMKRDVDLDDAYFSFLCDSLNKNGGQDGNTFFGDADLERIKYVTTVAISATPKADRWENWEANGGTYDTWKEVKKRTETINNDIHQKILNEHYGKGIFLTKENRDQWLGTSDVNRVVELLNHRAKSKFEVITEFSYADEGVMISEKLSLSLLSKIPFVVLGDKGYMKHLKELGFKTFDKFWDESYDLKDDEDRIVGLSETILDIQKNFECDINEHGNYVYSDEMSEILEHNYHHYKNVYVPELQNRILKAVSTSDSVHFRTEVSDKIWYNSSNQTVIVPIPGNGMEYFDDRISNTLYYKLVNRADVPNLSTLPAIVIIRNPFQRIGEQIWETGMEFDAFIEGYKNKDYMKTQVSFTEGLSVWKVIDLDDVLNPTRNEKTNYTSNYEHIISRDFKTGDSEDLPVNKWDNHIINHIKIGSKKNYCTGGMQWYTNYCSPYKDGKEGLTARQIEKVQDLFKEDFKFYNDSKRQEEIFLSNYNSLDDEMETYIDSLKSRIDVEEVRKEFIQHGEVLKHKMDKTAWAAHIHLLKSIGIQNKAKDISILDMGTQFGIIPHFLSSIGFTDVSCTNSSNEASVGVVDLEKLWSVFNLSPIDLHIEPMTEFTLPKKYDVIFASSTNILFKTNDIFRYQNKTLDRTYSSLDQDSMFFVPYNEDELEFFINNIKNVLNPGGVAMIHPNPWVYHAMGYERHEKLLSKYQTVDYCSLPVNDVGNLKMEFFVIRN